MSCMSYGSRCPDGVRTPFGRHSARSAAIPSSLVSMRTLFISTHTSTNIVPTRDNSLSVHVCVCLSVLIQRYYNNGNNTTANAVAWQRRHRAQTFQPERYMDVLIKLCRNVGERFRVRSQAIHVPDSARASRTSAPVNPLWRSEDSKWNCCHDEVHFGGRKPPHVDLYRRAP